MLYWLSTALATIGAAGAGAGLHRLFRSPDKALDRRKRLGVPTQGRLATRADLASLLVPRPRPGQVATLIQALCSDPAHQEAAVFIADAVEGLWRNDPRTVSSVYATARTLVWPFVDPTVAVATAHDAIDRIHAEALLSGTGSLYVCLPLADQDRLRPVVGGVLAEIVSAAYRRHLSTGNALDPPLLLVIDEVATLRPDHLPSWAATLAGIGVQLVTVWQSVAQIEAAYGRQSQAILTNHLTKVFYSGMSDTAGLDYVSALAGEEHLPARLSHGARRGPWDEEPVTTLAVAPPAVLRRMRRGDALLIHGSLPPAHIRPIGPRRARRGLGGWTSVPSSGERAVASPGPRRRVPLRASSPLCSAPVLARPTADP